MSFCLRGFIASRLLGEEEEGLDFHNYRRQIRLTGAYRRVCCRPAEPVIALADLFPLLLKKAQIVLEASSYTSIKRTPTHPCGPC